MPCNRPVGAFFNLSLEAPVCGRLIPPLMGGNRRGFIDRAPPPIRFQFSRVEPVMYIPTFRFWNVRCCRSERAKHNIPRTFTTAHFGKLPKRPRTEGGVKFPSGQKYGIRRFQLDRCQKGGQLPYRRVQSPLRPNSRGMCSEH